jgi:hypothetical protein
VAAVLGASRAQSLRGLASPRAAPWRDMTRPTPR